MGMIDLAYILGIFNIRRNRFVQINDYKKQLETYKIRKSERERISADMHDELGSGITAIRLMSETAKRKLRRNIPPELEKINSIASDMLNNLNAIIWSMHEEQDDLESLIRYIRNWATDFFEYSGINCSINKTSCLKGIRLQGEKRKNIFLCVKELLTNVLKHSLATEVKIEIAFEPVFKIQISDNGRGIDHDKLRPFGNGLRNLKNRMQLLSGILTIEKKDGTTVILEFPKLFND